MFLMKKSKVSLLILVTILFFLFTIGFLIGRNFNNSTISLSAVTITEPMVSEPVVTRSSKVGKNEVLLVNINTADILELMSLPGIGETLAERIIAYRNTHGFFQSPEELLNVEGIGSKKVEGILQYITTGG